MAELHTIKAWIIDFLNRLLPVVAGIAITISVQGVIDRAHARKEVRSALQLVRTELISNRQDIAELREVLGEVQKSAQYLVDHPEILKHVDRLDSTALKTLTDHQGMVRAEVSVTLPHDALELLKTSSIFQKIGDNSLSMKIIRAYDCCQVMVESINRHLVAQTTQTDEDLPKWLLRHSPLPYTESDDIDAAITAINVFLRKK